jgi:hypothetical protein
MANFYETCRTDIRYAVFPGRNAFFIEAIALGFSSMDGTGLISGFIGLLVW